MGVGRPVEFRIRGFSSRSGYDRFRGSPRRAWRARGTSSCYVFRMHRSEAIALLRSHLDDFRRFSVKSIALFGSVARDEAREDSDVDVLVDFTETPRWSTFL